MSILGRFPTKYYFQSIVLAICMIWIFNVPLPLLAAEWISAGLNGKSAIALGVHPTDKNIVLASVRDEGIYKSRDGGAAWQEVWLGSHVYSFTFDRLNPNTVYAGLDGQLLKSINGGNSFEVFATGHQMRINSIAIDETQLKGIFLGTDKGVYKSFDRGKTWQSAGLNEQEIMALAINSKVGKPLIYAATATNGIYKSPNLGLSWSPINQGLTDLQMFSIINDWKEPNRLYASSREGGIFKSENEGNNWVAVYSGIRSLEGITLAQAVDNKSNRIVVYAANFAGEVYTSEDNGDTWIRLTPPLGIIGLSLGITNVAPSTLYLGTTDGIFKLDLGLEVNIFQTR